MDRLSHLMLAWIFVIGFIIVSLSACERTAMNMARGEKFYKVKDKYNLDYYFVPYENLKEEHDKIIITIYKEPEFQLMWRESR